MKKSYVFFFLRNLGPTQMPCHSLSGYSPAIVHERAHTTVRYTHRPPHTCVRTGVCMCIYLSVHVHGYTHSQTQMQMYTYMHALLPVLPKGRQPDCEAVTSNKRGERESGN